MGIDIILAQRRKIDPPYCSLPMNGTVDKIINSVALMLVEPRQVQDEEGRCLIIV